MVYPDGKVGFRKLVEEDIPLLSKWLSDPAVLEYYEGRDQPFSTERVRGKFFKEHDPVERCLIFYDGKPIGYVQFYRLEKEDYQTYGYENNEHLFGMDQFIGEPSYWNKGVGTQLVSMMVSYLVNERKADRIVMDPRVENERAIRCYEKCGFQKMKLLPAREHHEGQWHDCWAMEYIPK